MEQVWRAAPLAALRVWCEHAGLRVELNDAGRAWSLQNGMDPTRWQRLAEDRLQQPCPLEADVQIGTPVCAMRCRTVLLPDGALLWFTPLAVLEQTGVSLATHVDAVQEFGRMGLFMRNVQSGRGYWDAHVFRIVGRPDTGEPPDFETFLRDIVHPEDSPGLRERWAGARQRVGHGSTRYRIIRPDGEVRHVHALFETRPSADGAAPDRMVGVMIDDTESVLSYENARRASSVLERAIELAGISAWRIDDATQRIHYNSVGFALKGLQADPLGAPLDRVREYVHPDDLPLVLKAADDARSSHEVIDVIARFGGPAVNGWRTLLTRRVAERDANGAVTGMTGVSMDLTALMAERARADAMAERARLATETIGVAFWARDIDAGTAYWDEQMYRIHHRSPEEGPPTMEELVSRHVHPTDRAEVRARQQRAHDNWEPFSEATFRIPTPDGSERWVQTWTRRVIRDGRRQSFGMHLDVTERHLADAALERERDRYRFAVDAAGIGIWERSLDGGPSYWNDAMYTLRGLDPLDPTPVSELAARTNHTEDQRRIDELVQRHLQAGEPYSGELRVRRPDGSVRWVATRGRLLGDARRRDRVMAGVNIDITERKQADALRQEMLRAEQASRDKSAFMARVSHELRTPMNAIVGFTELLIGERGGVADDTAAQRLGYIRSSARHLLSLIDKVLDLSHLDTLQSALTIDAVPVAPLLDEAVAVLSGAAQAASVEVEVLPSGDAAVNADRSRLQQVLVNLLANAISFNERGGWVRVSLRRRGADHDAGLGISVADSGRGIAATDLARIFEPFERAGAEREATAGAGIGLTIVREFVKRMAGEVEVFSTPGAGSEFVVWLPEAEAARAGAAEVDALPAPVSDPPAGTERPLVVLCVEDNAVNLQLVRELLALRPAMVLHTSENGLDAVALAPAVVPDLVLLDMHLPDIDGTEVMNRLRGVPALAQTRFIALSANAMPDHVSRALHNGFDDYWTKPIDFAQFLGSLDRIAEEVGR